MSNMSAVLFGAPLGVLILSVAITLAMLCVVAVVVVVLAKRVPPSDLPQTYLGVSYILSALAGFLPWGKTSAQPPLPQASSPAAEPAPTPTVLVMQSDPVLRPAGQGAER